MTQFQGAWRCESSPQLSGQYFARKPQTLRI